jgi:hypothetical protein
MLNLKDLKAATSHFYQADIAGDLITIEELLVRSDGLETITYYICVRLHRALEL